MNSVHCLLVLARYRHMIVLKIGQFLASQEWHNWSVLSPSQEVARDVRRIRLARKLSQRQLSNLAGFQQPHLCQVETGVRAISLKAAERLERALELKPGKFSSLLRSNESRKLWAATRSALKEFGRQIRQFVEGVKPRVEQPHQRFSLENPLWPMGIHLGEEAAEEVRQLELLRKGQT